jgi:hypothetical protein
MFENLPLTALDGGRQELALALAYAGEGWDGGDPKME